MALPASGQLGLGQINTELGRGSSTTISLQSAENGTYAALNGNSPIKPNSVAPHSVSEWHSYDHTAGSSDLILHLDATNPSSYPGTGLTWFDISGNGNDWTWQSVDWSSAGWFNLTDTRWLTRTGSLTASTAGTIVFWIQTTDLQALFLNSNAGTSGSYLSAYRVGNKEYHSGVGAPDFNIDLVSQPNVYDYLPDGEWHMVEFKNVNLSTWINTSFNRYTSYTFGAGSKIGMIKFYNKVLSAAESQANWDEGSAKFLGLGPEYVLVNSLRQVNPAATLCIRCHKIGVGFQDIGFVNGMVDIAAVETYAAGGDLKVEFYDQCTDTLLTTQPQGLPDRLPWIALSGSIVMKGGVPSTYWGSATGNGAAYPSLRTQISTSLTNVSVYNVLDNDDVLDFGCVVSCDSSKYDIWDAGSSSADIGTNIGTVTRYKNGVLISPSTRDDYYNIINVGPTLHEIRNLSFGLFNSSGESFIGFDWTYRYASNNYSAGPRYRTELIIMDNTQTYDATALTSSIIDYYNLPKNTPSWVTDEIAGYKAQIAAKSPAGYIVNEGWLGDEFHLLDQTIFTNYFQHMQSAAGGFADVPYTNYPMDIGNDSNYYDNTYVMDRLGDDARPYYNITRTANKTMEISPYIKEPNFLIIRGSCDWVSGETHNLYLFDSGGYPQMWVYFDSAGKLGFGAIGATATTATINTADINNFKIGIYDAQTTFEVYFNGTLMLSGSKTDNTYIQLRTRDISSTTSFGGKLYSLIHLAPSVTAPERVSLTAIH